MPKLNTKIDYVVFNNELPPYRECDDIRTILKLLKFKITPKDLMLHELTIQKMSPEYSFENGFIRLKDNENNQFYAKIIPDKYSNLYHSYNAYNKKCLEVFNEYQTCDGDVEYVVYVPNDLSKSIELFLLEDYEGFLKYIKIALGFLIKYIDDTLKSNPKYRVIPYKGEYLKYVYIIKAYKTKLDYDGYNYDFYEKECLSYSDFLKDEYTLDLSKHGLYKKQYEKIIKLNDQIKISCPSCARRADKNYNVIVSRFLWEAMSIYNSIFSIKVNRN